MFICAHVIFSTHHSYEYKWPSLEFVSEQFIFQDLQFIDNLQTQYRNHSSGFSLVETAGSPQNAPSAVNLGFSSS
jgi:hypothetical protein